MTYTYFWIGIWLFHFLSRKYNPSTKPEPTNIFKEHFTFRLKNWLVFIHLPHIFWPHSMFKSRAFKEWIMSSILKQWRRYMKALSTKSIFDKDVCEKRPFQNHIAVHLNLWHQWAELLYTSRMIDDLGNFGQYYQNFKAGWCSLSIYILNNFASLFLDSGSCESPNRRIKFVSILYMWFKSNKLSI